MDMEGLSGFALLFAIICFVASAWFALGYWAALTVLGLAFMFLSFAFYGAGRDKSNVCETPEEDPREDLLEGKGQ